MTTINPGRLFFEYHNYILLTFWGLLPTNPLLKTLYPKNFWIRHCAYPYQICFFVSVQNCQWSVSFLQNNMFGKNLFLALWSKNLKTTQNAKFFKLQYLTKKLRHGVEFLDVSRGQWKQQILVVCFKWVWSGMPGHT